MWYIFVCERIGGKAAKNTHTDTETYFNFKSIDGGGGDSSYDNGDVDDPNMCEKLHELVFTSTHDRFSRAPIHA